MVDLRSQILAARKPVRSQLTSEVAQAGGDARSIAPEGDSPFGINNKRSEEQVKAARRSPVVAAHQWADEVLRTLARRQERVILSVRDAARMAEAKGMDPCVDEIYVTSSIRDAWNLTPDQLSKGLKSLEEGGLIRVTVRKRGRHARFVLSSGSEVGGTSAAIAQTKNQSPTKHPKPNAHTTDEL